MTRDEERGERGPEPEARSALATGYLWASRVTALGLEFALPALLGVGIDRWLGTAPVVAIVGSVFGFAIGMVHVLRLSREAAGP